MYYFCRCQGTDSHMLPLINSHMVRDLLAFSLPLVIHLVLLPLISPHMVTLAFMVLLLDLPLLLIPLLINLYMVKDILVLLRPRLELPHIHLLDINLLHHQCHIHHFTSAGITHHKEIARGPHKATHQ